MKAFNTINLTKKLLIKLGFGLAVILTGLAIVTASNQNRIAAIPFIPGDESNASPVPAFNVFTGVPNQGDEADFLRARVPVGTSDSSTPYVDPLAASCAVGQKVQLRVYVHNGASVLKNNNGSGPSVAHGTKVKVDLKDTTASNPSAMISADNAASVNDDVTINCAGKEVKLNYQEGSAKQFSLATGTDPVDDSIVTTGAPINSNGVSGDVWGCFDQRVYVILTVEIEAIPDEQPSTGVCKDLDLTVLNRDEREVRAHVTGEVNNAQIVGYRINFGDGTVVNQQTANHKYAANGTFNIVGSVQIRFTDGTTQWKTASACAKQVTFDSMVTPRFACDALAVQQLSRTSYKFTVSGSAQNATITGYQFSLNGAVVQDSASNTYTLNQSNPGSYTVSAIVKTDRGNTAPTAVCTKTVTIEEDEEPKFACELLTLTALGDRKVKLSVDASAMGGATIKRYIYNFGDGSQPLVTDRNMVEYQYKKDGTFNSTVQVVVDVNGEAKIVTSDNCAASVTFKPGKPPVVVPPISPPDVPSRLPDTGAGDLIAAFLSVTVGGMVAYNLVIRRFAGL